MYEDEIKQIAVDFDKTFPTEKVMQKYCIDYVKKLMKIGVPIMVLNQPAGPHNRRGVSDLILSIKGKFIALELKNGKGNRYDATDLQLRFLKEVVDSGGVGEVIYTFEEFFSVVDRELK